MRQFILISVIFLTSMYGQKSNHNTTIDRKVKNQRHETESILENVPRRLSYQGLLTKVDGKAVTNGTYQVTFRLFENLMGGEPFWEEEQNILIADGVVSATLGSVTPISGVPSNAYLEIEINGSALSPRQEMTSVFYSVVSDTAKYAQAGNYMNLDDRPDLNVFAEKDSLSYYPLKNELDSVAFSGSYSHLTDVPNLDAFVSSDTLSHFVQKDSLGSISDQNHDNVNITGGDIQGITDLAIADGGTGASDNSTARSNLGLEIGVDIQAYDADLADLADGTLSAEKVEFLDNVTSDIQSQINALSDDHIHTLEDLNVTASSEELNYVQGVTSDIQGQLDDKQDVNVNLTAIADLEHNHDHFIVSDGTSWTIRGGPDARLSLGLGTIATQQSDDVSITGGSVQGITDLAIADGGTGASDITTARTNLGLEIDVDIQAYDADLADLADGELSANKVQYAITSEGTSGQVWTSDGDGTGVWGEPGTLTGAGSTIDAEDLTASRAVISNGDGKIAVSEVTDTELGYLDGVTSAIQTQIDGKQAADDDLADLADGTLSSSKVENNQYFITSPGTSGQVWTSDGVGAGRWDNASGITGAAETIVTEDLSASRAVISNGDGKIAVSDVTDTELGYLDGVTSSVQTQLNNKQSSSAALSEFSELAHSDGNVIVSDGSRWTVESGSDARLSLGLGSIATQASDNVSITGGSLTDIEDIAVADGGTGASDVTTARSNLGLEIGVDIQAYDDDLADLADGTLSASKVENSEYFITSAGTNGQVWTSDGDGAGAWVASSATLTGAGSTIDAEDLTASRALVSNASGKVGVSDVTDTELGYLDGVTSSIQTQIDGKQAADDDLADLADGTLSASKVENSEYFITSAGTNGQVWTSDGDGAGSWTANTAATSVNGLTDALVEDNSLYLGQDPSSTTNGALRNVSLGVIALDAVTTGDNNVAIGYNALTANTTGSDNMGVGYNTLKANVGGTGNSAIGSGSLASNTGGNYNTAVGSNSLNDNVGGDRNVGIGNSSLRDNSSGNDNTAVGKSSGQLITSGDDNVTIGHESGILLTTGSKNVILGSDSDPSSEDAVNQATLGYGVTGQANNSVTLGNADVTEIYMAQDSGATVYAAALGFGDVAMTLPTSAGSSGQVLSTNGSNTLSWANSSSVSDIDGLSDAKYGGDNFSQSLILGHETTGTLDDAQANIAIGNAALDAITSGDYNTTIGSESLTDNSTGYSNTGLGYRSLYENTTGNRNIAIGANALKNNTSGIVNVALGSSALQANTDANGNTAIGHASAISLSSGANNVSMGYNSAFTVTTGNNNVIIGAEANPSTDGGSTNQIVIGKGVTGKGDNSVTMGNGDITAWYPTDDNEVDLGSSTVEFKDMHLDGIAYADGITLENGETITNSTDGTVVIDGKTDFNDNALTGYGADLQTESGTSKTLAAGDNGTIIVCSSNSAVTITVPSSLPTGFNCMIIQNGSGQVSLSPSSTTLNNRNGSKTAGQYAILTLVHLGSNVFVVSGDTSS